MKVEGTNVGYTAIHGQDGKLIANVTTRHIPAE